MSIFRLFAIIAPLFATGCSDFDRGDEVIGYVARLKSDPCRIVIRTTGQRDSTPLIATIDGCKS